MATDIKSSKKITDSSNQMWAGMEACTQLQFAIIKIVLKKTVITNVTGEDSCFGFPEGIGIKEEILSIKVRLQDEALISLETVS